MKVSVCMIAYNHGKFLAQALDSVFAQKTDFDFEVVLGEDCSTDGTREIALEYQRKHPDQLRLLLWTSNRGMIPNFVATQQACKGEYIAFLEGDDFWMSEHKLQRQVELLDANKDCVLCFTRANVLNDATGETEPIAAPPQSRFSLRDLLTRSCGGQTCSVMLRNGVVGEFPSWFNSRLSFGDYPLFVLAMMHGDALMLQEPMAVYRVHAGGIWSNGIPITSRTRESRNLWIKHLQALLFFYQILRRHLKGEYRELVIRETAQISSMLMRAFQENENWGMMRACWWTVFWNGRMPEETSPATLAKLFLTAHLPRLYRAFRGITGRENGTDTQASNQVTNNHRKP